jgi:streptogrisin C
VGVVRAVVRVLVVVVAAATALVAVPVPPASALPPVGRWAGVETVTNTGELIRQRVGARAFAGYWIDEATGELTVGVTEPGQAAVVRALGGVPRAVPRNAEALEAIMGRLNGRGAVPPSVTGWYVDVTTNTVVVSVIGSDPAASTFAAAGGEGVRIEQVTEVPQLYWSVIDGQAIFASGSRCSAGFNARNSAGNRFVITAGHCTNLGGSWTGVGGTLGSVGGSSFPGNDYGVIRVTSASAVSTPLVDRYSSGVDVTVVGSTVTPVGGRVCRSGSTTGWRCGTVQARNQTVSYASGIVSGLVRTSACAEPGDSGGAFVSDPGSLGGRVHAQGVTSGGSGNCTSGGTTFFQPVTEVLSVYGLTLYTG